MKNFGRYLYSFRQNTRTWQTDGRTPHDGIGRAYAQHCVATKWWNKLSQMYILVELQQFIITISVLCLTIKLFSGISFSCAEYQKDMPEWEFFSFFSFRLFYKHTSGHYTTNQSNIVKFEVPIPLVIPSYCTNILCCKPAGVGDGESTGLA